MKYTRAAWPGVPSSTVTRCPAVSCSGRLGSRVPVSSMAKDPLSMMLVSDGAGSAGLPAGREAHVQLRAGTVQLGFHSWHAQSERVGGRPPGQALDVAHNQHGALDPRQL